jgi:hypothetical protein
VAQYQKALSGERMGSQKTPNRHDPYEHRASIAKSLETKFGTQEKNAGRAKKSSPGIWLRNIFFEKKCKFFCSGY